MIKARVPGIGTSVCVYRGEEGTPPVATACRRSSSVTILANKNAKLKVREAEVTCRHVPILTFPSFFHVFTLVFRALYALFVCLFLSWSLFRCLRFSRSCFAVRFFSCFLRFLRTLFCLSILFTFFCFAFCVFFFALLLLLLLSSLSNVHRLGRHLRSPRQGARELLHHVPGRQGERDSREADDHRPRPQHPLRQC